MELERKFKQAHQSQKLLKFPLKKIGKLSFTEANRLQWIKQEIAVDLNFKIKHEGLFMEVSNQSERLLNLNPENNFKKCYPLRDRFQNQLKFYSTKKSRLPFPIHSIDLDLNDGSPSRRAKQRRLYPAMSAVATSTQSTRNGIVSLDSLGYAAALKAIDKDNQVTKEIKEQEWDPKREYMSFWVI